MAFFHALFGAERNHRRISEISGQASRNSRINGQSIVTPLLERNTAQE
jgi:hypothetical protein